jgi:hypothetical protein
VISEPIEPGRWRLTFAEPEAVFLMNVLARLAVHYEEDLADLSSALRTFWQSGSSAPSQAADGEESREVLAESRAELRSERRLLAESWLREFEIAEQRDPWMVELTTAERDEFVAMLNDRRLILGLEIGAVSEGQLEPSDIPEDARRVASTEIDVLGHFIMVTLGPQIHRP